MNISKPSQDTNIDQLINTLNQACALAEVGATLTCGLIDESTAYFYFTTLKDVLINAKKYACTL